ncbi:hypothetical protein V8F33_009857 [Rhypophila sp. PSN 637]
MLYREVCVGSGNIRQAKKDGTELYGMYANVVAKVTSMNVLIRKVARKNTRQKFFEEINTVKTNKQIRNEHSAYLDGLNDTLGQQPSHRLEERKMLAELIFPQVQKRCARNQCFFCYWEHGDSTTFCTVYKARNHMKLHLRRYDEVSLICCPESNCIQEADSMKMGEAIRSNTYVGVGSFQSHLAKGHFYDIFKERAHFK